MQAPSNWCPLMHYTVSLLCDRTRPMAFTPPIRHTMSFCDRYSTGAPLVHYTIPLLRDCTRSTCSGTCDRI